MPLQSSPVSSFTDIDPERSESPPPEHIELSRLTWVGDYLLALAFLVVGAFYYMFEATVARGMSTMPNVPVLAIQLALHFTAAYLFLTNHFVHPRTHTVLLVITAWRMLLLAWSLLLLTGFWALLKSTGH